MGGWPPARLVVELSLRARPVVKSLRPAWRRAPRQRVDRPGKVAQRCSMPSIARRSSFAAIATALLFPFAPTPAEALTKCKARTLLDGTIAVTARDVVGTPRWGFRYDGETTPLDDTPTCIDDGKARDCALAPVGMPERTELPPSCTIYFADDGAERCSAWVKRCYASS